MGNPCPWIARRVGRPTVTALGRRTPRAKPPPLRDAPTLTPRPPDRRAGGEYYDDQGNFVGKPEPTCEEAAKPWLDNDCPCRHDYPDEQWCKDACALCEAREELWSLGAMSSPTTTLDGIYLGKDDFLFTVTVKHISDGQGTILARHSPGVATGWSLIMDAADHVVLTIYGSGGGVETLKSGTPLTPDVEQVLTLERRGATVKLRFDGADPPQINHIFNDGWNWNDEEGVVSPDKLTLGGHSDGALIFQGLLTNVKLEGGKRAGIACCTELGGGEDQYTKCSSTDMAGTSCSPYASMTVAGLSCVMDCSQPETIDIGAEEIGATTASYWACQCRPE